MAACGVKPNSVDAPQSNSKGDKQEKAKDTFPHVYPAK